MANTYSQIYIQIVFAVEARQNLIAPAHNDELVRGRFSWQEGFGAFSYSHSQLGSVVRYIQNQQKHHQRRSFQNEYTKLLDRFDVPYDERYIFKFIE